MKLFLKYTAIISALTLIFLTFSGCTAKPAEGSTFAMGSLVTSKIYTKDKEKAAEIIGVINDAVSTADKALSDTNPDSDIYRLNHDGKIFTSEFLINAMMDTVMTCNILERSVDISIGKISSLWGFNTESPSLPDDAEIKKHTENADIEQIFIDEKLKKIEIPDTIALDMGAFGKGIACDLIFDSIKSYGKPVLVSFGGTVFACGAGPKDGKWTVAIRDPLGDSSSVFAVMSLSPIDPKGAVFVSTSGCYEKNFTQNNVTYHHIIDPKTGYPVENNLLGVTVITASGLDADALSTACFVNGYNEETLACLKNFSAEAVFIFKDKTYAYTEGLKDCFTLKENTYSEMK